MRSTLHGEIERLRCRLEQGDWEQLLARLDRLGRRAAIVGPRGSGKTTLLEELAPRLVARGLRPVLLRPGDSSSRVRTVSVRGLLAFAPTLELEDVLLVDSAESLPRWVWWRLRHATRRAGGLVITAHRPGRLPTLVRCTTSPELLAGILDDLLGPRAASLKSDVAALHGEYGGDLRAALFALYDREPGTDRLR